MDEKTRSEPVRKEPPREHEDTCVLCKKPIAPDDRVAHMHGVWMHRTCYQKDLYA
jgi:hypothetical protein